MLSASLLVITLAMPATGQQTRLELTASGNVTYTGYTHTTGLATSGGPHDLIGGADVTAVLYLRRLVDDDAAPSLQPFLQRASRFSLGGGGVAFASDYISFAGTTVQRRGAGGDAWLSLDGYFGPSQALYGSIGFEVRSSSYADDRAPSHRTLDLPLWVSLGVRWRDLRVRAGWSITPRQLDDDVFRVAFWGGASFHIYGVVKRWLELSAETFVLDGGASARGGATLWLKRRFGVDLGVGGGRFSPYRPYRADIDWVHGDIGLTAWITPRLAANAAYSAEWTQYPSGSIGISHFVTVRFITRPL